MPELPDIELYLEALRERVEGRTLDQVRLASPFLLRSFETPLEDLQGRRVIGLRRLGKRIVFGLDPDYFAVVHLMIAGRLHWKPAGAAVPRKRGLAAFDFSSGTLLLTEAGTTHRAALHVVRGERSLAALDAGGIDVFSCTPGEFRARLTAANHTLKRALCDPAIFSGIGNAYSDEILHAARLSPFKQTRSIDVAETERLLAAIRMTLRAWLEILRKKAKAGFPGKVTAFHPEMAVHGKYGQPCTVCGAPVQRIVYAGNEANYCAPCQTGGKLLRDRALSRLLRDDWPASIEEMEALRSPRG